MYKFSRDENLKRPWLIKTKRRNIQSIQPIRMCHAYCFGQSPGWKKMRFQLALNKTFCPTPPPFIYQQLKHRQRTKINKTMLCASPIGFPHKDHNIRIEKQANIRKYFNLTITELGPPVSESSTFIKQEWKIGYP